jgi:beta-galactosidase GanA
MNTLLLPVSWENIEPEENNFDFDLVDGLIMQARQRNKHIVFLWFGTWKNAECMYAPAWVKTDLKRFRRAQIVKGLNKAPRKDMYNIPYTTLSYLCEETCKADANAFARFMSHLKDFDSEDNTVVAVQVENETGLLGAAREMSDEADVCFHSEVPLEFAAYLRRHTDSMVSDIREAILTGATSGTWTEQFGSVAEELFSAYYIATYVEKVASAGKEKYPLPMLANCWLDKGDKPGTYPTGGPVSRVHEVWHMAAPSINILCPDIYVPNFCEVCDEYTRRDGTLFIPECATHSYAAPRLVYTVGHYHAMCYAPFGFEDMGKPFSAMQSYLFGMDVTDPALKTPQEPSEYRFMAEMLNQLMPQLVKAYGSSDLQAICSERKTSDTLDFEIFFELRPCLSIRLSAEKMGFVWAFVQPLIAVYYYLMPVSLISNQV